MSQSDIFLIWILYIYIYIRSISQYVKLLNLQTNSIYLNITIQTIHKPVDSGRYLWHQTRNRNSSRNISNKEPWVSCSIWNSPALIQEFFPWCTKLLGFVNSSKYTIQWLQAPVHGCIQQMTKKQTLTQVFYQYLAISKKKGYHGKT